MKSSFWAAACAALALFWFDGGAAAQMKIRVGKAQAQQFAFVPVDVGIAAGIFKKHGVDIEIENFAGDAKLLQGLAAGSVDIALGGGPTLAFIPKGTPMLGIAALADAPGTILLVVLKNGPVKTEDDLKGRTVSVSTKGSLTYWLAQELSRQHGWGNDGIKIAPLGSPIAQVAALRTGQIDGVVTDTSTIFRVEEEGIGRILVRFSDHIKDFHVHAAFASKDMMAKHPDAVRAFLAAWFETIKYMETHKDPVGRHRRQGHGHVEDGRGAQLRRDHADLQPHRAFQAEGARCAGGVLRRDGGASDQAGYEQALHRRVLAEAVVEQSFPAQQLSPAMHSFSPPHGEERRAATRPEPWGGHLGRPRPSRRARPKGRTLLRMRAEWIRAA